MTSSGNSQPVARTPVPDTTPTLENASATGVRMLLLLKELRTNVPIDPEPMPTRAGTGVGDPTSCKAKPLKVTLAIVESFSRTTAATLKLPYREIWQFSKERFEPTKL